MSGQVTKAGAAMAVAGGGQPWEDASFAELDGLVVNAMADGARPPTEVTLALARDALRTCALAGVTQPLIDHDGAGGIEIYLKEGDKAILVALREDGDVCAFNDGPAGSGRDRRMATEGWTGWLAGNLRHFAGA